MFLYQRKKIREKNLCKELNKFKMSEKKIRGLCENRSGGSELRTTSRVTSENQGSIIKIVKDRINYYEFESVTEALLQSRIRQITRRKEQRCYTVLKLH